MKKLIAIIIATFAIALIAVKANAQDTLEYGGMKFYKGQEIRLGQGSKGEGGFKYVTLISKYVFTLIDKPQKKTKAGKIIDATFKPDISIPPLMEVTAGFAHTTVIVDSVVVSDGNSVFFGRFKDFASMHEGKYAYIISCRIELAMDTKELIPMKNQP